MLPLSVTAVTPKSLIFVWESGGYVYILASDMLERVTKFVLGEASESHLPGRVRAAIDKQQQNSEELIAWVQLIIISFFGFLYLISPRGFQNTEFAPVPYALAGFFGFCVVRLILTHKRVFPRTLPLVGVVADILLLLMLVWIFHIQYMQPAPFYLKVPTLLYVFIFIALRALRFDPVFVIVGGVTAAVGWIGLVVYAIHTGPMGMDVLTRDFVEYTTAHRVLIGAEMDKILVVLTVTAILALTLIRARRLLESAVSSGTTAKDLSRFVAPELVDRIATGETEIKPGTSELRTASILFTDIEGFSTISEKLDPQGLMQTLNDYFAAMSEIINRHGGVIEQYQGDALLVSFNASRPLDDHSDCAIRTALDIQQLMETTTFGDGLTLRTRCGINTGEVVVGAFGSSDRLLFTVHGDEVNIAARLEQMNKDYGTYVLVSDAAIRQCSNEYDLEEMGEVTVRGRQSATRFSTIRNLPALP